MAIKIITGKPGSGKSYFALNKVILEGFSFDKKTFEWKPKKDEITIITNVEGLKLPHYDLQQMANDYANGDIEKFFTCDIQQQLTDKFPRIRYIIDECQRYFHSRFYNKDTFFYFQYHRHYGHDIYMIAQVWDSITKHITGLCEYEFRAVPKSLSIFNEFNYGVYSGWDKVGSVKLTADKKIFALYMSFQNKDFGKEIRPLRKFAMMAICLLLCAVGFAWWWLGNLGNHSVVTSKDSGGSAAPARAAAHDTPRTTPSSGSPPGRSVQTKPVSAKNPADYVLRYTGGFVVGDVVKAIQWNGRLVPADSFPYQWSYIGRGQIQLFLPVSEITDAVAIH